MVLSYIGIVTEPYRRGLHRRAPCSRVHLAYSLRQLRVQGGTTNGSNAPPIKNRAQ